jgi:hypothetical protein
MSSLFGCYARNGIGEGIAAAVAAGDNRTDFRASLCHFEDDLFAAFPAGHGLMDVAEANAVLADVFGALARKPPRLSLVAGFADPRVGGYADVAHHRIAIERGHLYRFLVLHESAHLIVPDDRRHGPGFTFVLQLLYRSFFGIPEEAVRHFLRRHRLPALTTVERRKPAIGPIAGVPAPPYDGLTINKWRGG